MTPTQVEVPAGRRTLRLWPGVVVVALQWLVRFVVPAIHSDAMQIGVLGGMVGALLVALWWLFFSRAPWIERLGAVVVMALALVATRPLTHESIATGAMGMLFYVLAAPLVSLAFVAGAVASRGLADGPRRAATAGAIVLGCGVPTLVRTGGFDSNFDNDLHWRWAETPEDRLLAQAADKPEAAPSAPVAAKAPEQPFAPRAGGEPAALPPAVAAPEPAVEWPGYRGRNRDGIVSGVRIETDWSASPPVELWRRPIGPGWSSFAVRGDLFYTQEQRGEDEIVACYRVSTGEPVWGHRDKARFWESNGGAGPRATPTLGNGRVYALGATGILNALDAGTGAVAWSRDAASDTGAKLPTWGFAGSPLVVGDLVVVAASGTLAAYEVATGAPRWKGAAGREGYSSPQLATIDGVPQVLLVSGTGVASVAPSDGKPLWEHEWRGYPIVQPASTADGDVLISVSDSSGMRRIAPTRGSDGWSAEERWTSIGLKPYFNDFVVHEGHAFGFDGRILSCIDLADGKRKWKGGRYGQGQLVLLPDQDLLLVLSEEGELALVAAATDQFRELARFPALEGKTWNHPVLAGEILLVRNAQEMAAFRLSRADR